MYLIPSSPHARSSSALPFIRQGRIWSFFLGFRSLVARLAPLKHLRKLEQRGRNFLATESVNSWESVNSSPIVRIFGEGKCKLIANFSETMVTSLRSTVKSCIKAAACVQFFSFLMRASIQVRLLFEGGLYAMFWVCKTRESSLARRIKCMRTVKAKLDFVNHECHEIVSKRKHFGMQKAAELSSTWTISILDRPFSSCGFCLGVANVQLEFGESTASIRVRLLIKCGFVHTFCCQKKVALFVPTLSNGAIRTTSDRRPRQMIKFRLPSPRLFFPLKQGASRGALTGP